MISGTFNEAKAKLSTNKKNNIRFFRRGKDYSPDWIVEPKTSFFLPQRLPSEPPEGIEYTFCPTGYWGHQNAEVGALFTEDNGHNNYCHWLINEVPMMLLLLDSPAQKIVVPDVLLDGRQKFQREWWQLLRRLYAEKEIHRLSLFESDLHFLRPINDYSSLSKTPFIGVAPYYRYHSMRPTPYTVSRLQRVPGDLQLDDRNTPPWIYINRKTRRLKNELEVQSFLRDRGFKIVNLERLALREQMRLFNQADIVVGFHGAGLANLVFAKPGTKVIEIADPDCVHPTHLDNVVIPGRKASRTYFHILGHLAKLNYMSAHSSDYYLNIDVLEKALYD